MITKKNLRMLQRQLLHQLELTTTSAKKKALLAKLEYYEAVGDRRKGRKLSADQKLHLFTKEEYLKRRQNEKDAAIYQSIGVSRRLFYLWKKRQGLVKERSDSNIKVERRQTFSPNRENF
ncbi:hypothetical protein MFLO_14317 [Listeria floridensis FSL S10-1187]|uniref:Uncharacterized protein n=1 Tax=Listeria floridensis FSL S10-1187 TaxID=1265817 RepID=A0ABN0RC24_9LIST|nr:hypothetical protein [Listeria floridensis]EUJ26136.1 hypothetical protein MFLO_14317 [Listeria floridensis FSL S10-1187]